MLVHMISERDVPDRFPVTARSAIFRFHESKMGPGASAMSQDQGNPAPFLSRAYRSSPALPQKPYDVCTCKQVTCVWVQSPLNRAQFRPIFGLSSLTFWSGTTTPARQSVPAKQARLLSSSDTRLRASTR